MVINNYYLSLRPLANNNWIGKYIIASRATTPSKPSYWYRIETHCIEIGMELESIMNLVLRLFLVEAVHASMLHFK